MNNKEGLVMKTFHRILSDMAGWVRSSSSTITNFHVGSIIRTILESVAMEMEAIYFQMHSGFRWAVENSIMHSFDFYKYPATPSTGELTLLFSSELPQRIDLPAGYTFSTVPGKDTPIYFKVIEDTTIPFGVTSATVKVQCTESGLVGNVPSHSIKRPQNNMPFLREVYNDFAFVNGTEEESKEERKKRFNMFIDTLSRGTSSAILYGCLKVPRVTGAYVDEGVGVVEVYVHDADGNLSEELKTEVVISLRDYRAAGIQVVVSPVIKTPIDLQIKVLIADGFDSTEYCDMIKRSVESYLNYQQVSNSLIISDLISHIMTLDKNAIKNVNLSVTSDIKVDKFELIRAGEIQVSVM